MNTWYKIFKSLVLLIDLYLWSGRNLPFSIVILSFRFQYHYYPSVPQLIFVSVLHVRSTLKRFWQAVLSSAALSQQLLPQLWARRGTTPCTPSQTAIRWCSSPSLRCWPAQLSSSSVSHSISVGNAMSLDYFVWCWQSFLHSNCCHNFIGRTK